MGEVGERRYKYWGIIEADLINEKKMKKIQESKKEGWNLNVEIKIELKE